MPAHYSSANLMPLPLLIDAIHGYPLPNAESGKEGHFSKQWDQFVICSAYLRRAPVVSTPRASWMHWEISLHRGGQEDSVQTPRTNYTPLVIGTGTEAGG